jgi:hypothetical protein
MTAVPTVRPGLSEAREQVMHGGRSGGSRAEAPFAFLRLIATQPG